MQIPAFRARHARARLALPDSPREIALEWLKAKIEDGHAGLDPYDRTLLIFDASATEVVWAYRSLELVGAVIHRAPRAAGGERLKAVPDADARVYLHLDGSEQPLKLDEPLASRSVKSTDGSLRIRLVGDIGDELTGGMLAARRAEQAYHERQGA